MKKIKAYLTVLLALLAAGVITLFISGDLTKSTQQLKQQIKQQVAADAIKQYEIAECSGEAMDAYVQAGLVAAAFLQAGDEDNYQKWKMIEKHEGINAGMPLKMLGLD